MHKELQLASKFTVNNIYVVKIVSSSFNEAVANLTNLIKCVICTLHYEYNEDNVFQELE